MSGTNPVALYSLLNNATVSDVTTYKGQIDANSVVAARIVDNFAPHAAASPNMTVILDAGHIFDGITQTEVAQQTSGAIAAPSGSNKRIDRAVIDRFTGTLSIITGTPTTGTPAVPAITAGNAPVAQIGTTASPLLSTTTAITNSMIVDERDTPVLGRGTAGENNVGNTLKASGNTLNTKLTTEGSLASASTADLGSITTTNIINITGTTTITSFGTSATTDNPLYITRFSGAVLLTNGANLLVPGAANYTTAAGDVFSWKYENPVWRCVGYALASGKSLTGGATADEQNYTGHGTYTWTKPAGYGAKSLSFIECVGAGASGGSYSGGNPGGTGGGGGGGSYKSLLILTSSLGATETVTVGTGGAAASSNINGSNGGFTSFGTWVKAFGGTGGAGPGGNSVGGAGGGVAATATAATNAAGLGGEGNGAPATAGASGNDGYYIGGGGGGGAAGGGGNGGNSVYGGGGGGASASGTGGSSSFGGAGGAGSNGGTATSGTAPGGGGGGVNSNGTSGAGADGQCKVTTWNLS